MALILIFYPTHCYAAKSQENFDAVIGDLSADGAALFFIGVMAWLAETEVSTLVNNADVIDLARLTQQFTFDPCPEL
jgi:hypothetical protein